jgi:CubicO group peptidase (beta-lactamase class C family)
MEFAGSWSTDSVSSDFEKMETGVNGRAIDFAKLGALFLNGGLWQGKQVISNAWVEEATQPLLPENYDEYYDDFVKSLPDRGYYNAMWWGMAREDGGYDFSAAGDKGQFIYVSPEKDLVIVRHGIDFGITALEWYRLLNAFARQY